MSESRDRNRRWWWISVVVVLPVLVLTGVTVVILQATIHPSSASDRIDVVKTALSVGAGTGGVVALVLAGRRQLHAEKAHQATEHDATERRITELYGKAVEQLGSDKAPVRLGGLYALERLAQDNPGQRQSIVEVICAYLRMPYELPSQTAEANATAEERAEHRKQVEEQEVRLAAQDILTRHVLAGHSTFRPDTDIDLTRAALVNIQMAGCRTRDARFDGAQFTGDARFDDAWFDGFASFDGAQLTGDAHFVAAKFYRKASFNLAVFTGRTSFRVAFIGSIARFTGAQFAEDTSFEFVWFGELAWFDEAQFTSLAQFRDARFFSFASFDETRFSGSGRFNGTEFARGFNSWPGTSSNNSPCWVRLHSERDSQHYDTWPAGRTVRTAAERPKGVTEGTWGILVESSPAVLPDPPQAE